MGYTSSTVHGIQVPDAAQANNIPTDLGLIVSALEGGSIIKRLTGAQIAALTSAQKPAGLVVYNTTTNRVQISDGTNFHDVVDARGGTLTGTLVMGNSADVEIGSGSVPRSVISNGGSTSIIITPSNDSGVLQTSDRIYYHVDGYWACEAPLSLGSNKITSLADGTANADAVNKSQLDAVSTVANAALPKAGGTMTGAITLPGNPSNALHAAPKQYVDTKLASSYVKAGVVSGTSASDGHFWITVGSSPTGSWAFTMARVSGHGSANSVPSPNSIADISSTGFSIYTGQPNTAMTFHYIAVAI